MTSREFFSWLLGAAVFFEFAIFAQAAAYRIEPDDYAESANLNDVLAVVDLRMYNGFIVTNFPSQFGVFPDPSVIPITANNNPDIFGGYFTSTGTKSFGAANVPFFNESSQLGMKFSAPASQVTIDFIGRNLLLAGIGVLEIYSPQGVLLDTYTSAPLMAHQVATLTLTRPQADIGYARAFSDDTSDVFGALDNLRFVIGASSLNGDFNGSGAVDTADYVVWRNGLGTTHTANQYQTWRQNFGAHNGTGSLSGAAIPEPATLALLLSVLLFSCVRRPR
jgi:hypothetical protein